MLGLPLRSSNPDLADKKYIAAMFASGEQGAWYDPSDLSTMYQDAAGTIPVTAVGQPVGKILDKSGRGNHATQSTTASRPTLSARVNLLTKTEQFNDAAWLKTNATIAANAVVAPDGTTTADTFIPGAGTVFGSSSGVYFNSLNYFSQGVSVAAATYKYRLRVKYAGYDRAQLRVSESSSLGGTNQAITRVLLSNGAVLTQAGTGNLTNATAACARTDDGWCDITLTFTSGAAQTLYFGIWAWNTTAITSDGVKGLHIWGADLRVANESANLPTYQRVNTNTDYDTAGFPYYLLFDGVDDSLVTANINFSATDKMTVLTADHSAWDNATRVITGLSNSVIANDGTFWLTSYDYAYSATSMAYLRGNLRGAAVYGPDQRTLGVRRLVRSFRFDISKDVLANETLIRLNGVPTPLTGTPLDPSAGSGNFGNWPLYIGRVGGSYPFSGRLYGLIVRGAATDDSHLTHAEKYLAYKSGVTL